MKVGVLAASISRQAGGLFWAVRSLSSALRQQGCEINVFSIADQYSDQDIEKWSGLDVRLLTPRGPASFGYSSGYSSAIDKVALDLVHTHGLWMYPSVAALRWHRKSKQPMVISPHGMLDPWALHNSAWKKKIAGRLYENAHLRESACLHALCISEYESMRAYGLRNPIAVIPNGVELPDMQELPPPAWAATLPSNSKVLLFLSRVHPKKGLENLLKAWAHIRHVESAKAEPWYLVIAGWDQAGHTAELERSAENLGINNSVHFVGPQFNENKAASFTRADAFVLPSFSEGLPMAVLEAWSYSLPVLMTPQCNLPEGFEAEAAIAVMPEVSGIAAGLSTLFNLPESERLAIGQRGYKLVTERFTWTTVAAQMYAVYAWVLGQGAQPSCVITD